jgi:hypothetical protein
MPASAAQTRKQQGWNPMEPDLLTGFEEHAVFDRLNN